MPWEVSISTSHRHAGRRQCEDSKTHSRPGSSPAADSCCLTRPSTSVPSYVRGQWSHLGRGGSHTLLPPPSLRGKESPAPRMLLSGIMYNPPGEEKLAGQELGSPDGQRSSPQARLYSRSRVAFQLPFSVELGQSAPCPDTRGSKDLDA